MSSTISKDYINNDSIHIKYILFDHTEHEFGNYYKINREISVNYDSVYNYLIESFKQSNTPIFIEPNIQTIKNQKFYPKPRTVFFTFSFYFKGK
jgi:hypothetical protein